MKEFTQFFGSMTESELESLYAFTSARDYEAAMLRDDWYDEGLAHATEAWGGRHYDEY